MELPDDNHGNDSEASDDEAGRQGRSTVSCVMWRLVAAPPASGALLNSQSIIVAPKF